MERQKVRQLTKQVRKQKRFSETIKYLSKEQTKKLFQSIDDLRNRILIKLMYETGMRVSEAVKCQIGDIDFENRTIYIPAQNTKTKKARQPRIPEYLVNEIKAYMKAKDIRKGFLFPSKKRNSYITARMVGYIVKAYGKKCGFKWIHPHSLRHSLIVHSLMDQVPLSAVQSQVGHVNLNTTQIYSTLASADVKEMYDKYKKEI